MAEKTNEQLATARAKAEAEKYGEKIGERATDGVKNRDRYTPETMREKAKFVKNVVQAKCALDNYLARDDTAHEMIEELATKLNIPKNTRTKEEELAELFVTNPEIRTATRHLVDGVLNPTPVTVLKVERSNSYIDIGFGVSVFWEEMNVKHDFEIEQAMKLENILVSVEAGLDKDINPDVRKSLLQNAGLSSERVEELIPFGDYAEYDGRTTAKLKETIIKEYGMSDPLTEDDANLLADLVNDRRHLMDMDLDVLQLEPQTFEEAYGVAPQIAYDAFTPKEEKIPEYAVSVIFAEDPLVHEELGHALDVMGDIYNASIEDTQALYESIMNGDVYDYSYDYGYDYGYEHELPPLDDAMLEALAASQPPEMLTEADLAFAYAYDDEMEMGQ